MNPPSRIEHTKCPLLSFHRGKMGYNSKSWNWLGEKSIFHQTGSLPLLIPRGNTTVHTMVPVEENTSTPTVPRSGPWCSVSGPVSIVQTRPNCTTTDGSCARMRLQGDSSRRDVWGTNHLAAGDRKRVSYDLKTEQWYNPVVVKRKDVTKEVWNFFVWSDTIVSSSMGVQGKSRIGD